MNTLQTMHLSKALHHHLVQWPASCKNDLSSQSAQHNSVTLVGNLQYMEPIDSQDIV